MKLQTLIFNLMLIACCFIVPFSAQTQDNKKDLSFSQEIGSQLNHKLLTVKTSPQTDYAKELNFYSISEDIKIVNCDISCNAVINPYATNYNYDIIKEKSGYLINPLALVSHTDLYLDKSVKISQEGDYLFYPKQINEGEQLIASRSKFIMKISNSDWDFYYDFSFNNRQIIGTKDVVLNSKRYTAKIISSNLILSKYLNGHLQDKRTEKIIETYVEGFGPIEIEREVQHSLTEQLMYRNIKL